MERRPRLAEGRGFESRLGQLKNKMRCGRTAYPSLTGQRHCGWFSLEGLNEHPACDDAEKTLPVCATKPGFGPRAVAVRWLESPLTRCRPPFPELHASLSSVPP